MDVRDRRTVHRLPSSMSRSFAERRPGSIGHITLRGKCAGARSAGKPHAACDVAGAGNGLTVRLVRHSHRKRGETDRPRLRSTAPALDPTAVGSLKESASPELSAQLRRWPTRRLFMKALDRESEISPIFQHVVHRLDISSSVYFRPAQEATHRPLRRPVGGTPSRVPPHSYSKMLAHETWTSDEQSFLH